MEIEKLIEFLSVAEKLKCNTRHSWTSSGRHESVAEHSWRLAFMALFMKDEFPDTDINKVVRMCLIHDIGEAVTGDIPAFEKTERDTQNENREVEQLFESLPEMYCCEFKSLLKEMEEQKTNEAKLYKALDKLETLIQHNEADISTWLPLEYDLQMTYGTEECTFSEHTAKLRKAVRTISEQKIKDTQ